MRFYDGGSDSPPAVMWRYKELRRVCRVSVLPVPFTVGEGEDWPLDVKVSQSFIYNCITWLVPVILIIYLLLYF